MDPLLPVGETYRPVVADAEVYRADDENAQEDADDDADGDILGLEVALAVRRGAVVGEETGDGAGGVVEWPDEGWVCSGHWVREAVLHLGGRGGAAVGEGTGEGWYIHASQIGQGVDWVAL